MECSVPQPTITAVTPNTTYPATVIITTKNRKDELRKAIDSTLAQTAKVEILIFDDGSTDGTSEMVRQHYPQASLHRVEQSLGINKARNRAIELASAPIVLTIDDDCVFPTSDIIRQTLAEFDHPRIGAVAIPCIHMYIDPHDSGIRPPPDGIFVCSEFRGCANAMRRDLFLQIGRYRGFFHRQGEEGDYCLRLLDAGYVVRVGRADAIHHYHSPIRDHSERYYYQCRNNILYAWYNVPMPYMLPHLAVTVCNSLACGLKSHYYLATVQGTVSGFGGIAHECTERRPVTRQTYRLMRRLKHQAFTRFADIEPELSPMHFSSNG
ncbi:MAG: glycosyltransferase family 2 protein [Bacillota bacterium]